MTQLAVDDLTLEVRESSRRKTLEITVDRDGELVIAAPRGTDERLLRDFSLLDTGDIDGNVNCAEFLAFCLAAERDAKAMRAEMAAKQRLAQRLASELREQRTELSSTPDAVTPSRRVFNDTATV